MILTSVHFQVIICAEQLHKQVQSQKRKCVSISHSRPHIIRTSARLPDRHACAVLFCKKQTDIIRQPIEHCDYREERLVRMSRIALIGSNSIGYIQALIDIWNNEHCAVLIDHRTPFHSAIQMMRDAGVRKCCLQEDMWSEYISGYSEIEFVRYPANSELTFTLPNLLYEEFHPNYSNNEAVIIYSSGTTGKSKGIILSHLAINTNADAIIDYMAPSTQTDCIYTVRHLSHSSTLTGELLVALKTRTEMVLTASVVLPRLILSAIKQYGVTILCLNPTLLSLLCDEINQKTYDLSSLQKVYVSGAVLNDAIYAKAKSAFAGIHVFNVYGLSEAAPRVAAQTSNCCKSNSVGKPIKGIDVAITDESGTPVSNGVRGIIHVKTPSLFSGYVTGNEKHTSFYQGWLNTGDIGFWNKFGELIVVGRADDMIICNAHKVYPSDVEQLILEDPSISDCAVSRCMINGAETIGCIYVSCKNCAAEIVSRLKASLAPHEIPKRFLKVQSIPRNDRGKIERKVVADILFTMYGKDSK